MTLDMSMFGGKKPKKETSLDMTMFEPVKADFKRLLPKKEPLIKPDIPQQMVEGITEARSFPIAEVPETPAPLVQPSMGGGRFGTQGLVSPELRQEVSERADVEQQRKDRLRAERERQLTGLSTAVEEKAMAQPQRMVKTIFGEKPVARTFKEMQSGGFVLPKPNDPEYQGYLDSYKTYTAEDQAFGAGFVSSIDIPKPQIVEEAIQTAQAFKPETVQTGKLAGKGTQLLASYLIAGPIAGKLGVESKVARAIAKTPLGKTLSIQAIENLGKLGGVQAANLLVDTMAQSPFEVYDFVTNDKDAGEDVKQFITNRAIDIGFNLAFQGAEEGIKSLKNIYKSGDNQARALIESQANAMTPQQQLEVLGRQIDTTPVRQVAEEPRLIPIEEIGPTRAVADQPTRTIAETTGADGPTLQVAMREQVQSPATPIEQIVTEDFVMTELPKVAKRSLSDQAESIQQALISKRLPLERISEATKIQSSNLNRVAGSVEYNVLKNQTNLAGEDIGKSVVEIFGDVPVDDKKSLFDYAFNQHNIDRFKQGKPVFGDTVSDVASAKKVADLDTLKPEFKAKAQEIVDYNRNLLNEWAVKSGLVSEDTAKMLNEMYPNYVPTYRLRDVPKSLINSSQNVAQVVKKAKGSERAILPLDQQMIIQTERTIKNARKNQIMNTLNDIFDREGASKYILEVKDTGAKTLDTVDDVGRNLDIEPQIIDDKYVVNFYKNGQPKQMVVNKNLYKALTESNSDTYINKVLSTINKYATQPFKNLITGYNPIFAASNILRDVPTALSFSSNPANLLKNSPKAVQEMLTNGPNWRQFQALGGTREGLIGAGKEFRVPNLGESKSIFKKISESRVNPIKTVGDVNNFTETLPRFSEYLNVLEKTGDPALALYRSAELTTDFSRYGELTKQLDSLIPYLNPAVQGMDKFAREIVNNPLKTSAKAGAFITVPTLILDQINKDNNNYNNLPARERNLYFNIPFTDDNGDQKFIRIPKSRELGVVFSSLAEWASRASRGQKVEGKEIASAINENFSIPIQPIWTPAVKAYNQIKDPEAYETNYWGGLIVPESQRQYSPGNQYDQNSSGIAKAIGQQFNISPYVIDYFIKSYSGIIGQVAQADTPLESIEKKFINDPLFKNESIGNFYEALGEAKQEAADYNRENNIPSKEVTPLEKKANAMQKIAKEMSAIRKEQKTLDKDEQERKIRKLQKLMNDLAEEGLNVKNRNR